jgi:predicted ATPase
MFLHSLKLDGLLSFAPGSEPFELQPLNLIIGPNGSGKSNLIEAIELLKATPTAFASAIRDGGGVSEWLWKGEKEEESESRATLEAVLGRYKKSNLRYGLSFQASGTRLEVIDEFLEEASQGKAPPEDYLYYYRFNKGHPVLSIRLHSEPGFTARRLNREDLLVDESVLSQRKDPEMYPELTWCGASFNRIQTFREWTFGRYAAVRQPQPPDLPTDVLLPGAKNLALLLSQLEHDGTSRRLNELLRRFLPTFERYSVPSGPSLRFFFHEKGLTSPLPSTRLSDGTIRFLAMLVLLLHPNPPPLICIEEPELGLHPDAVAIIGELLLEARERTQLIVTTHSDALISALSQDVESVVVCEHRGGTVLSRLESERLRFWLDKYSLGDLWRMGELGGNP